MSFVIVGTLLGHVLPHTLESLGEQNDLGLENSLIFVKRESCLHHHLICRTCFQPSLLARNWVIKRAMLDSSWPPLSFSCAYF